MKGGQFGPSGWPRYQRDLWLRVQTTMNRFPVSVALVATYHSFALQVDKAKRQSLRGDELHDYCRGLVALYLEKRLEREVMEAILQNVFDVRPESVRPKGSDGDCE